jgi:hypothetical protein
MVEIKHIKYDTNETASFLNNKECVFVCVNGSVEARVWGDRVFMPICNSCEESLKNRRIESMIQFVEKLFPNTEIKAVIGSWPEGKWGAIAGCSLVINE